MASCQGPVSSNTLPHASIYKIKQDLVNKYHKAFSAFVESTDFEALHRSDY